MTKRNFTALLIILLACPFSTFARAEGLQVGAEAPYFKVKSGDGNEVTLNMVKGKIVVIFYETKEVAEQNRKLKSQMNISYHELSDSQKAFIVRLPVINCSSAFWPITAIWKSKLRENSLREGLTIYGDWDGNLLSAYRLKDRESNVVIIDRKGIIRYFSSGKIENDEIARIKNLLKELIYSQ